MSALVRPVAAQEPAGALDTRILEEVVVTAQRREERLQDVPIAVTAVSHDTLARRNAVDLSDLPGAVPGLSIAGFTGGNASNLVSIRGVAGQVLPIGSGHVDISLHGKSFWAESPDCEGGEWSLAWAGEIPGETRNVGDLLISYGSFDTTIEDEEGEGATGHAKPTFQHTPIVCRDNRGAVVMRASMSGTDSRKLRGVLAMKNDPARGSPPCLPRHTDRHRPADHQLQAGHPQTQSGARHMRARCARREH
ncbi:MAG: Plug domain-containing protein [Gammaproteobacteria bacterium]